jgi:hypothetical protein
MRLMMIHFSDPFFHEKRNISASQLIFMNSEIQEKVMRRVFFSGLRINICKKSISLYLYEIDLQDRDDTFSKHLFLE